MLLKKTYELKSGSVGPQSEVVEKILKIVRDLSKVLQNAIL